MRRAVIAGAGYVGRQIAHLLAREGWSVTGFVRASTGGEGNPEIRALDVTDPESVRQSAAVLARADAIVYCVSSGRGGVEAYRSAYLTGLKNVLAGVKTPRVIFTSSTSVYAQTDGPVVDESSLAEPARETGMILREAEDLALAHGGCVARLGGIYGPGRSVYLKKFLEGTAVIEGDGSRWVNQIHRDDAAAALAQLATSAARGIYNVVDDQPMSQLQVYEILARHFQCDLPPGGPVNLDRKRGWTSKRVSNSRLRETGWRPEYPSYADAIRRWGASLLDA